MYLFLCKLLSGSTYSRVAMIDLVVWYHYDCSKTPGVCGAAGGESDRSFSLISRGEKQCFGNSGCKNMEGVQSVCLFHLPLLLPLPLSPPPPLALPHLVRLWSPPSPPHRRSSDCGTADMNLNPQWWLVGLWLVLTGPGSTCVKVDINATVQFQPIETQIFH